MAKTYIPPVFLVLLLVLSGFCLATSPVFADAGELQDARLLLQLGLLL